MSSLRKGYYGASAMPTEILNELQERLPNLRLWNFYGQTEMAPLATAMGPEDQREHAGAAGRPAVNVETAVIDDNDQPVPPGTVGEIAHRGPHLMLGYLDDPVRTAEAFRGDWFHSGDLGYFDEFGQLHVVDRKKDMIKTGGENVASREVEEVMYRHPKVEEVAVFGIPHPVWVEAVVPAVVIRDGAQPTRTNSSRTAAATSPGTRLPSRSSSSTVCRRTPAASCSNATSVPGSAQRMRSTHRTLSRRRATGGC